MAKSYSGDKIVVTGKEVGSLYPTNREEAYKEIVIDGAKESFEILGGVFSKSITITGGGMIKGPIFSKDDIQIKNTKEAVVMQSGITALNSLVIDESGKSSIENKLSYSIKNANAVIRGDVISDKKVILNDTIVIGSIIAPDVKLNHCIVFGAIKDSKQISITNSTIGIYITDRISFDGTNGFFIAGGKSKERPVFIDVSEEKSLPQLRFLPLCRLSGYGCAMGKDIEEDIDLFDLGLACSLWAQNKCPLSEYISVEKIDFTQLELGEDDSWYLGLQSRSLALNKINEINENFNRVLHGLFAFDHLSNEDKELEESTWKELSKSEKHIFSLATI